MDSNSRQCGTTNPESTHYIDTFHVRQTRHRHRLRAHVLARIWVLRATDHDMPRLCHRVRHMRKISNRRLSPPTVLLVWNQSSGSYFSECFLVKTSTTFTANAGSRQSLLSTTDRALFVVISQRNQITRSVRIVLRRLGLLPRPRGEIHAQRLMLGHRFTACC